MFELSDFDVFNDPTLQGRLDKIRHVLDPKFERTGAVLAQQLGEAGLPPQTVHIAKHLRRTKNPPVDTWLALSATRRGYKIAPHLELGFWDDRLFLWVALLAESKATALRIDWPALRQAVAGLPEGFELSGNHMAKSTEPLTLLEFDGLAQRFQATKAGEWLVGKTILRADPLFQAPKVLWSSIQDWVEALVPVYGVLSGTRTQ